MDRPKNPNVLYNDEVEFSFLVQSDIEEIFRDRFLVPPPGTIVEQQIVNEFKEVALKCITTTCLGFVTKLIVAVFKKPATESAPLTYVMLLTPSITHDNDVIQSLGTITLSKPYGEPLLPPRPVYPSKPSLSIVK